MWATRYVTYCLTSYFSSAINKLSDECALSPWKESLLLVPVLPRPYCLTDPHRNCFQRLGKDHADDSAKKPTPCQVHCQRSLLPFVSPTVMEVSPPEEDDIFSSASPRSATLTTVGHNFPSLMTILAGHAGLTLAPLLFHKPVHEGFYGSTKPPTAGIPVSHLP